ncbi:tetratricopeptide repeat protein [Companilactobacillus halodurans]|uniref:Tetratricopeptide repeat protein n=1 Tax=Companilactobacillus halodurans TaxID=2584183 RepID=A0A5P0ZL57_9LACO|nr:tetratricopeptide repeat protein [Companilactobacillus halodurans]MQS74906.1 tetratricopeptide repeat protein [Companilactobacillus halodurans]MQS98391.1 tetratricopeptide repeat protein [Companilactobacillus halodurans]
MDDSNNLKKIIDQADEAFDKGNWIESADLYTQAYSMQQSFSINKGLAASLLNQKRPGDAEAVILDYFNYYLSEPDTAELALDIVLENNDFLLANQMLNFYDSNTLSNIKPEFLADVTKRIRVAEDRHERSFKPEKEKVTQRLLSIVTESTSQQIQLLRKLRQFNRKDYIESAKILLENPLLHPLLKSEALENLLKLGLDENVDISFYGKNKTCNPSKLMPIMSTDVYLKMCDELEKLLTDENDAQMENFKGELSLYSAFVYPFGDEIITKPTLWTKAMLLRYGLVDDSQISDNQGLDNVKTWLKRFDELINTFQE